ncbi:MAG: acylphosphatase [Candidatus Deferrimicrobiaceae bacterium]
MKTVTQARVVVSGRVQGVFFRASTRDVASRCGVRGYVRNLPERQVEAVLQGERSAVEKVIAFLREGPPGAVVTDIAVDWRDPVEPYEGFHVRY